MSAKTSAEPAARTGVILTFTAKPGQRDALASHLLAAARSYDSQAGTKLFTVNLSPVNADQVIVIETYGSAAAHAAHEQAPSYAAIRATTGTFLAGPPVVTPLLPLGGKGL